jgi:hypothetical protein
MVFAVYLSPPQQEGTQWWLFITLTLTVVPSTVHGMLQEGSYYLLNE